MMKKINISYEDRCRSCFHVHLKEKEFNFIPQADLQESIEPYKVWVNERLYKADLCRCEICSRGTPHDLMSAPEPTEVVKWLSDVLENQ
jgi:hypothetical protein